MLNKKSVIIHLVTTLCFLIFSLPISQSADVYLTIGNGSGSPGSENNPVTVQLENQLNKVKGVEFKICDEGNYLSCSGCNQIGRASEFSCYAEELKYGCTKIIIFSVGNLIEEGEGPILSINYDVKERASSGECIRLKPLEVQVSGERKNEYTILKLKAGVQPGEFCFTGGSEDETSTTITTPTATTSSTTTPPTHTTTIKTISDITKAKTTITKTTVPATYETTTTTTTSRTLPPLRTSHPPSTPESVTRTIESSENPMKKSSEVTTPPSSPHQVFISPSSIRLNSGGVAQFSAKTISDGKEVTGRYSWKIVPASTIGSTINEKGQLTVGNNTSDSTLKETIRVTDTIHENTYDTATITIEVKKQPLAECELLISPLSATIFSGDTIIFTAKNIGKQCVKGLYQWKTNSGIGSQISVKGIYTAGNNESGNSAIDIIIVEDNTNRIKTDAIVTVLSKSKSKDAQIAADFTQKPQQKTLSGKGLFSKVLIIIIVLSIPTGIVIFWKIKR